MGVVYKARHRALKRLVALKVMRERFDRNQFDLERFRNEAELIARLQHPSFVQIFEVCEIDGRACLALEYVEGGTLASRLRGAPQPPLEAARLVESLARAMSVAHAQGLIHRDLKPANILMTTDGIAKISDFGLAKRLQDDAGLTQHGAIVGTPSYMSPEQASGEARLGPGVDIFALGAILYELLVGRPPFKGVSILETLDQVRLAEPVPPSRLQSKCPHDLETISLKCLEKDPLRRYATASELADDLGRFLADRPILARSVSSSERTWRWCRRNPILASACGVILLLLVGLSIGSFLVAMRLERDNVQLAAKTKLAEENEKQANHYAERAKENEAQATQAQQDAQKMSAELAVDKGLSFCESGNVDRGLLWLIRALELVPPDATDLQHNIRANLHDWQGQVIKLRWVFLQGDKVAAVTFSPDSKTVVTAGRGKPPVQFWNTSDYTRIDRMLRTVEGGVYGNEVTTAVTSRDGKLLLTGSWDGTARLWDFATGEQLGPTWKHDKGIASIALSPDAGTALTGCWDNYAYLWDTGTGEIIDRLKHRGFVQSVVFSPSGDRLVTSSDDGTFIWDAATRKLQRSLAGRAVGFVPNTENLMLYGWNNLRIAAVATGKAVVNTVDQAESSMQVSNGVNFSSDGKLFATAALSGAVWINSTKSLQPVGPPVNHSVSAANTAVFSPKGTLLVSGGSDKTARVWDYGKQAPNGVNLRYPGIKMAEYDSSGTRILSGGQSQNACLWDVSRRQVLMELPVKAWVGGIDPTKRTLFVVWKDPIAFDFDQGSAVAWPFSFEERGSQPRCFAISPDGQTLALGTMNWRILVWNTSNGKLRFPALDSRPWSEVTFSPDSRLLAVGDDLGRVELRDSLTGKVELTLQNYGSVKDVVFSRDGASVLVATVNTRVWRWNVRDGKLIDRPLDQPQWFKTMEFSPDARWLATGRDGLVRIWDLESGRSVFQPIAKAGSLEVLRFRPDSKQLLVGTGRDGIWLFDLPEPFEGTTERLKLWVQMIAGKEMMADGAIRGLSGEEWHARRERLAALGGPPIAD
jgi:WD40 repeat protein/serine/threonine protein kinase